MQPLRIFVGFDPRQPVAFQTLVHSIWSRASLPVSITRLQLNQLPLKRRGLTEFTYSRYMVLYLCGYEGEALFDTLIDQLTGGGEAEIGFDDACLADLAAERAR